jgi:MFS family permease
MPDEKPHRAPPVGRATATATLSAWQPLRIPVFRNLLIADLASDIGTFMQTVGAAWLMTTLTSSTTYIALIQTAAALPFFLLALPAGSLGDIFDRRKLILSTETYMFLVAVALAALTYSGRMTPWLLLLLTLALSLGDAVESPAWRAIFPELVKKEDLQPALALNGIEFNLARATGPGLAGLIVAIAGVAMAFVLNAISFLGVIFVIFSWKRPARKSRLPAETLGAASMAAIRYVRYSPGLRTLMARSGFVIFFASSFWALLPTVAKELSKSPLGYGFLLGFFGVGAVLGAIVLQSARRIVATEAVVSVATAVYGAILIATAALHHLGILCGLMLLGGAAWTVFLSTFNTMVQNLAPEWVRARVLAAYLFVYQGSGRRHSDRSGGAADFRRGDRGDDFAAISPAPAEYGGRSELVESLGEAGDVRASGSGPRAGARDGALRDRSGAVGRFLAGHVPISAHTAQRRGYALGDFLRRAGSACVSGDVLGGLMGRARTATRSVHRGRSRAGAEGVEFCAGDALGRALHPCGAGVIALPTSRASRWMNQRPLPFTHRRLERHGLR